MYPFMNSFKNSNEFNVAKQSNTIKEIKATNFKQNNGGVK